MQELVDWHFDEIGALLKTDNFSAEDLFEQFKTLAGQGEFGDIDLLMNVSFKLTESFSTQQNLISQAWILCLRDSQASLNATAFVILQLFPVEPIASDVTKNWKTFEELQKARFLSLIALKKTDFPKLTELVLNDIDSMGDELKHASLEYLASLAAHREIFMTQIQKFYESADNSLRARLMFAFARADALAPSGILLFRKAFHELPQALHLNLLKSMSEITSPQADIVELLLSLASSRDAEFQTELAHAFMGHVAFSEKVQVLLKGYLASSFASVREGAITSLGGMKTFKDDLHEPIYLCLADEDEGVRETAFSTLWKYETQAVILRRVIEALCEHPLESMREFALKCLTKIKNIE